VSGNGDGKHPHSIEHHAEQHIGLDGQTVLPLGDSLSLKVGGATPTSSELKIRAVPVTATGQIGHLDDGEVYRFYMEARLEKVEFVSERDVNDVLIGRRRVQTLKPIRIRVLSDGEAQSMVAGCVHI